MEMSEREQEGGRGEVLASSGLRGLQRARSCKPFTVFLPKDKFQVLSKTHLAFQKVASTRILVLSLCLVPDYPLLQDFHGPLSFIRSVLTEKVLVIFKTDPMSLPPGLFQLPRTELITD